MTIAQQIKNFHGDNISDMMTEAEDRGVVTQDWESESTEYEFIDGSVLIVSGPHVSEYGSR